MAAAFLCRPTAAVFIALAFVLLVTTQPRTALKAGIAAFAPVLLFAIANQVGQGQLLPWYYSPGRLLQNPNVGTAALGLTLSPSRGVFVFSPFLLVVLLGSLVVWRRLAHSRVYWFALAWFVLLVAAVCGFEHWWGGLSYGPRLLTEAVVPLLLLAFMGWQTDPHAQLARLHGFLHLFPGPRQHGPASSSQ